ncbi:MAG: hypothetical protein SLRJCFUN_002432 [Candidatus Fervidibacter sp.]
MSEPKVKIVTLEEVTELPREQTNGLLMHEIVLARNGYLLRPTFEEASPTLLRLALGTGVWGEMTYDELARWLEVHSVQIAQCEQT